MYVGVIFGIYNYMCFERGNDFFFAKKKRNFTFVREMPKFFFIFILFAATM